MTATTWIPPHVPFRRRDDPSAPTHLGQRTDGTRLLTRLDAEWDHLRTSRRALRTARRLGRQLSRPSARDGRRRHLRPRRSPPSHPAHQRPRPPRRRDPARPGRARTGRRARRSLCAATPDAGAHRTRDAIPVVQRQDRSGGSRGDRCVVGDPLLRRRTASTPRRFVADLRCGVPGVPAPPAAPLDERADLVAGHVPRDAAPRRTGDPTRRVRDGAA